MINQCETFVEALIIEMNAIEEGNCIELSQLTAGYRLFLYFGGGTILPVFYSV